MSRKAVHTILHQQIEMINNIAMTNHKHDFKGHWLLLMMQGIDSKGVLKTPNIVQ
jgi:hypothetical protein